MDDHFINEYGNFVGEVAKEIAISVSPSQHTAMFRHLANKCDTNADGSSAMLDSFRHLLTPTEVTTDLINEVLLEHPVYVSGSSTVYSDPGKNR